MLILTPKRKTVCLDNSRLANRTAESSNQMPQPVLPSFTVHVSAQYFSEHRGDRVMQPLHKTGKPGDQKENRGQKDACGVAKQCFLFTWSVVLVMAIKKKNGYRQRL